MLGFSLSLHCKYLFYMATFLSRSTLRAPAMRRLLFKGAAARPRPLVLTRLFAHRFKSGPIIPTTAQPEGFRASDQSVSKRSSQTQDGRHDPFKQINHERARTKNDFDGWNDDKEFKLHPILTPLVPLLIIGGGIAIIISGIIAHPPGDD